MLSLWVDIVAKSTMLSLWARAARVTDTQVECHFGLSSVVIDRARGYAHFFRVRRRGTHQLTQFCRPRRAFIAACLELERFKSYSSLKIRFPIDAHVKKKFHIFPFALGQIGQNLIPFRTAAQYEFSVMLSLCEEMEIFSKFAHVNSMGKIH